MNTQNTQKTYLIKRKRKKRNNIPVFCYSVAPHQPKVTNSLHFTKVNFCLAAAPTGGGAVFIDHFATLCNALQHDMALNTPQPKAS